MLICVLGEGDEVGIVLVFCISIDTHVVLAIVALHLGHVKGGFLARFLNDDKIPYATSTVAFVFVGLVFFDLLNTIVVQEIVHIRTWTCVLATREQTHIRFIFKRTKDHMCLYVHPYSAVVFLEDELGMVDVVFAVFNHVEDMHADGCLIVSCALWDDLRCEFV